MTSRALLFWAALIAAVLLALAACPHVAVQWLPDPSNASSY